MTVLVTGATGRIGGRLAAALAYRGVPVRALVRDRTRAGRLPSEVDIAIGDYADAASLEAAFHGVERAFMVCLPEPAPARLVKHHDVVTAAARAGVGHLVYLSFLGAAPDSGFPQGRWHAHTEADIESAGIPRTHLRAGLYQSSLLTTAGVRDGDRLLAPAAGGQVAPVAWQDIADVAAAVLTSDSHIGRTYDLTGPQLLGWHDIADILGSVTGEHVAYQPVTPEHYRHLPAVQALPPALVDGLLGLFADIRAQRLATCTGTVQALTGAAPTTLSTTFAELAARGPAGNRRASTE